MVMCALSASSQQRALTGALCSDCDVTSMHLGCKHRSRQLDSALLAEVPALER
jgi:hypothetical protein